ncbi:protein of unknown function [Denitratisoma oestradiolicum]|uniref:Uncharacterized protein n=1 Tax=Denitratisoma oestradiolicum TaxID=311182 RepID=A0A6S6YKB8_9PROT|nr:protein of unknown function [Denitratisoma oestradiolicum]
MSARLLSNWKLYLMNSHNLTVDTGLAHEAAQRRLPSTFPNVCLLRFRPAAVGWEEYYSHDAFIIRLPPAKNGRHAICTSDHSQWGLVLMGF